MPGYSDGFPAHSISGSNKIGLWRIKDHFIPPSYLVIYLVSYLVARYSEHPRNYVLNNPNETVYNLIVVDFFHCVLSTFGLSSMPTEASFSVSVFVVVVFVVITFAFADLVFAFIFDEVMLCNSRHTFHLR